MLLNMFYNTGATIWAFYLCIHEELVQAVPHYENFLTFFESFETFVLTISHHQIQ